MYKLTQAFTVIVTVYITLMICCVQNPYLHHTIHMGKSDTVQSLSFTESTVAQSEPKLSLGSTTLMYNSNLLKFLSAIAPPLVIMLFPLLLLILSIIGRRLPHTRREKRLNELIIYSLGGLRGPPAAS